MTASELAARVRKAIELRDNEGLVSWSKEAAVLLCVLENQKTTLVKELNESAERIRELVDENNRIIAVAHGLCHGCGGNIYQVEYCSDCLEEGAP